MSNQDPTNELTEDNDVSANDLCLLLSLDADNSDLDNNGSTGVESNWRLPSQKELMQGYINGAANNLPTPARDFWSSTEYHWTRSQAWRTNLANGLTLTNAESTPFSVRCVRRD